MTDATDATDAQEPQPRVRIVPVSEAWRFGLSPADVRWLLGIPEPPRKPPTYQALLRRCERNGCTFVAGVAEGWEVCQTHGVARRKGDTHDAP